MLLAVNAPTTGPIKQRLVRHIRTIAPVAAENSGYGTDHHVRSKLIELHNRLAIHQKLQQRGEEEPINTELSNEALANTVLHIARRLYSSDPIKYRHLARYQNYETIERFLQDLAYGEKPFDRER